MLLHPNRRLMGCPEGRDGSRQGYVLFWLSERMMTNSYFHELRPGATILVEEVYQHQRRTIAA
jgi:hypothetical protein